MDYEEKQKWQMLRVVIAEIGMVISIVAIVVVATMAAMGFFISGDGQIEQSGLMQLHSLPTGATVQLDETTLFARTNLSRTMAQGEHRLKLTRDGYDAWEKTISMAPGALLRLYYPRLFLQNRTPEVMKTLTAATEEVAAKKLEFYSVAEGREYILYALEDEVKWHLLDVRGDEVKETVLDLSGVLPAAVLDRVNEKPASRDTLKPVEWRFTGKILAMKWSANQERVLVKLDCDGAVQWLLVDLKNVDKSQNLTVLFGVNFERLEIIDGSANQLYALEKQQLRRINAANGTMSRVLVNGVAEFMNRGSSVIYLTPEREGERQIGVYHEGDEGSTVITTVAGSEPVKLALSRWFDEDYIAYVIGRKLTVVFGSLPVYKANGADLSDLKELVVDQELSTVPQSFSVSQDGEYLVARDGQKFMVLDLDMGQLYEYEALGVGLRWLDASMMYAVTADGLVVWDFDGTNERRLYESVTEPEKLLDYPVMVTANNRYLYYLAEKDDATRLVRERIRD